MLHRYVYYRRVPPFRPGKGYTFCQVLLDSRLYVHSRREVEKFSSVAIGMASETIATYMALRAGMIGQQRHSTSSQSYSACSNLVDQSTTHKNVSQEFFFCLGKNMYEVIGVQYTALSENEKNEKNQHRNPAQQE